MPTPTITDGELAVHLRIATDATAPLMPPLDGLIEDYRAVAFALLEAHAGPDTPMPTLNLATAQICGFWYEAPAFFRNPDTVDVMRRSGASALISPWRVDQGAST